MKTNGSFTAPCEYVGIQLGYHCYASATYQDDHRNEDGYMDRLLSSLTGWYSSKQGLLGGYASSTDIVAAPTYGWRWNTDNYGYWDNFQDGNQYLAVIDTRGFRLQCQFNFVEPGGVGAARDIVSLMQMVGMSGEVGITFYTLPVVYSYNVSGVRDDGSSISGSLPYDSYCITSGDISEGSDVVTAKIIANGHFINIASAMATPTQMTQYANGVTSGLIHAPALPFNTSNMPPATGASQENVVVLQHIDTIPVPTSLPWNFKAA